MATRVNEGWLILITEHRGEVDVNAWAEFFVERLRDTPVAARRWRIHKAGRGDAHVGSGAPTRAQLAVPELAHGLMVFGDAGFLSLLSYARTRRVDKNWARLNPERTEGYQIQLNLKALGDDDVDAARARALALLPTLGARGGVNGVLEWRARGKNHEQVFEPLEP